MGRAEIVVLAGGVGAIAVPVWYFFGSRTAHAATVRGGVQEVDIEVKVGYSPHLVRVKAGVPVRLVFDRRDNSGCTERGAVGVAGRRRAAGAARRRIRHQSADGDEGRPAPLVGKRAPEIAGTTIDGDHVRPSSDRAALGAGGLLRHLVRPVQEGAPRPESGSPAPPRGRRPRGPRWHLRRPRGGGAGVPVCRGRRVADVLVDPDGRIAVSNRLAGVPELFLISPDGLVTSKILGGVRAEDLEHLLRHAKAQRR